MKLLSRKNMLKIIKICSVLLFIGCALFLLYYLVLQPYYSRKVTQQYRNIYYSSSKNEENITSINNDVETEAFSIALDDSYKNNSKDANGILLKFSKLLEYNSDIKGWLSINGTNIDYPVMQDFNGGDFYLDHDFEGNKDKNGSLYIDGNCNVEDPSKNIVIHGHNMQSTRMMFYELLNYNRIDYYKEHPVLTFDSIYKNSQWKIISFMRVAGAVSKNDGFNYMTGTFENDEDFLDFLYQIESRSLYYCPVDVNEDDRLLMLSTCSYEIHDYRTVVVARRVRKGESTDVDVDKAYLRQDVLFPNSYYKHYGGEAPVVTNFADAISFNEINWYDGNIRYDSSMGKIVEVDNLKYKITSDTTVSFAGCVNKKIKELKIPSNIEINDRKFEVTEHEKKAFQNLSKLKTLKIGNSIKEIKPSAFTKCSKLESIVIGDNVEIIGKKAFNNLENLKKIKIKSTKLEKIEDKVFKGIFEKPTFNIPEGKKKKYIKLLESSGIPEKSRLKTFKVK